MLVVTTVAPPPDLGGCASLKSGSVGASSKAGCQVCTGAPEDPAIDQTNIDSAALDLLHLANNDRLPSLWGQTDKICSCKHILRSS